MSELARKDRAVKRGWARPGGAHDYVVRFLKFALPVGVLAFIAYLLISPLSRNKEVSFLLDKKKVATASERLKTQAARYQGVDDQGRAFIVNADRAVQKTSQDPTVDITGVRAEMQMKDGPAHATADSGRYHMDAQTMDVDGPIHVTAANGYKLETRNVTVDLNNHTLKGNQGVEGTMPLGRFDAANLAANMRDRHVTLTGRAHLHIDQGGLKRLK